MQLGASKLSITEMSSLTSVAMAVMSVESAARVGKSADAMFVTYHNKFLTLIHLVCENQNIISMIDLGNL